MTTAKLEIRYPDFKPTPVGRVWVGLLSRYPSAGIATHQFNHFIDGNSVEITIYGMFQAGSRHSEIQGFLIILRPGKHTIYKSSHKRITTSDPVNNVRDLVGGRFKKPFPVPQDS
jgi:deoxyinosine 3'endonuclease (endonuclease V)